jgi:predicted DNA-binding protein (MmcQ/YjbR family)
MNVSQLKNFCRGFPSATETLYGEPYNFLVYGVGGKKYAYFKTSHPERWRFSIRVAPDRFIELTDVPGVKPARYRGRFCWISIVKVSGFPPYYLTELVEWSYQRAVASLSRAKQTAICSAADAAARNPAVNKDAPSTAHRATRGSPVTFVR